MLMSSKRSYKNWLLKRTEVLIHSNTNVVVCRQLSMNQVEWLLVNIACICTKKNYDKLCEWTIFIMVLGGA